MFGRSFDYYYYWSIVEKICKTIEKIDTFNKICKNYKVYLFI